MRGDRHVGQLELRPVLDENFPAETGGCQVQTTLYGGYHSRITLTSNYLFFSTWQKYDGRVAYPGGCC